MNLHVAAAGVRALLAPKIDRGIIVFPVVEPKTIEAPDSRLVSGRVLKDHRILPGAYISRATVQTAKMF